MSRTLRSTARRIALAAIMLLLTLGLQMVASPPKTMAAVMHHVYRTCSTGGGCGVYLHNAPAPSASRLGLMFDGDAFNVNCWVIGPTIINDPVWLQGVWNGQTGYVTDYYIDTVWQTTADLTNQGIPPCGTPPPPPPPPPPSSGTYVSRTEPIRFCVDTSNAGCQPSGVPQVGQNTAVTMICWQDGSNFTGDYTTNRWFWVRSQSGVVGFLSASVVRRQTTVPACSTNRAITAAEAAVARYGQVLASAADRALFASSEWKPGPVGEWSGDCVKLGYVAWHAAGVWVPKGNALPNFRYYQSRGMIHGGVPPVGALVWYNIALPYGHEVVSLGDGFVATTVGMDWAYAPNTVRPYTFWSNYLGWALPG